MPPSGYGISRFGGVNIGGSQVGSRLKGHGKIAEATDHNRSQHYRETMPHDGIPNLDVYLFSVAKKNPGISEVPGLTSW
jgi:hypothetical protein